jgi:hypothetical protein
MTDNNDTEEVEEVEEQPMMKTPEIRTFQITTVQTVEVDFTERQLQLMKKQNDCDTDAEAIKSVFFERVTRQVEPEQKLMRLDVDVNEPSDE